MSGALAVHVDGLNLAGQTPLGDLTHEQIGQLVLGAAQSLLTDRFITAIEMSGLAVTVNGVRLQDLMDEVDRRKLTFTGRLP